MNNKDSTLNVDLSRTSTEKTSIITLIPCGYDSSEDEGDYENSSQNSIDSSELVDDSEDEVQLITKIYKINQELEKNNEKNDEINW